MLFFLFSSYDVVNLEPGRLISSIETSYLSTGNSQAKEVLDNLNLQKAADEKLLSLMVTTLQRKR